KITNPKLSTSSLVPALIQHFIPAELYKTQPIKLDTLLSPSNRDLISRLIRSSDSDACLAVLFTIQQSWFTGGCVKGVLKEIFESLLTNKILPAQAFVNWRDDTKNK